MSKKIPHLQVDAFPIVDDHFSGVGHYTLGIIRGFDELAGEGKLTYSLIVPKHLANRVAKYNLENYDKIIRNPIPQRVLRGIMKYKLKFPMDLVLGPGCYYFPSFLAWPMAHSRAAVVIHDVTYLAVPDCVEKANREYLKDVTKFSISNASNIITISKFSKSEIMKYYGLKSNQISIAYPSVDRELFYKRSQEEIYKVRLKYDIYSENYILAIGNVEPRKNYTRLVQAYTKLSREITDKYPLVIVGAGSWNNKEIKEEIQKAKEAGYKIINPKQFVLDEDMPALYSGAQFMVFVSIYEGFGMPPLEAYACGTPVLASNAASIPEAAGKAAIYADPFRVSDITAKLKYMVEQTEKNRDKFLPAIREHLNVLNWRESAEVTATALTGLPLSYFKGDDKK